MMNREMIYIFKRPKWNLQTWKNTISEIKNTTLSGINRLDTAEDKINDLTDRTIES